MTNNVPKLRFPEFTDEWNSLSLNDVSNDCSYGVSASATEFDREYKYIRITDIDDDTHKFTPSPLVSPKGDIDSKYILHEGDLVFARTGATVGKSYLYEPSDGTLVYAGYLIRFHIDRAVPKFIFYLTNRSYYWNWVSIMSVRSGQPGINMEEYKKLPIIIPSNHEQEKITSFLSKIDKKIDLLRDKKDEYIEFKHYLLQNLFPRNDELTPKLRFEEFTEEWKSVQIKDIFSERNETNFDELALLSVTLNNGVIPRSEIDGKDNSINNKNNYKHVKPQDIVYNSMRMWQGANGVSTLEGIVSPAYTVLIPKKDICSDFYGYYFKINRMLNEFKKYSQGLTSDTWNLKYPLISQITIKTTSREEQEKIASFLSFVDKKIDLLYQEIEQVEEYKKGLLQKMFI